jgi:GrpB-like predicted nucleotidyltransferase (UPF0157 family)
MASGDDGAEAEVLMLGAYPFYTTQPTAAMDDVYARNEEKVRQALGDGSLQGRLLAIHRIGSSAINGLPGTPVVDMLAVTREWPPDAAQLAALQAAGFEAKGLADHAEDDMWFFGGDGPSGTLGRCVLHVVREGNAFVKHSLDFVCYVSHPKHRDAFDAYAAVKLEGARLALDGEEGQKLSEYKRRKHAVCMEVMTKANAWGAAGGGVPVTFSGCRD